MKRSTIQTALLYAIATGVWIFGIDLAIDTIVGDHVWLARLHAILGVLAVAVVYAVVSRQLRARRLAEQLLRQEQAELEFRVQIRTAELENVNRNLQSEVGVRMLAEENLRMIERDLASQRATLKAVIDSADGPIFSVDRNYCYTSFNSRHAEVMKELYGADIKIGGNLLEYHTNAHDRSLAQKNIDRALRGEVVTFESSAGDQARSRRYFEISHNPVRDTSGQVTGVAVYVRDMTNQKQAREQIEHLASFPKLNPNPIIELDQHGTVKFFNAAAVRVLKELGAEADVRAFLPSDLNEILVSPEEGNEERSLSREVRIKDRIFVEHIHLSKSLNVVRLYATDITLRAQAELALKEREREYRGLMEEASDGIVLADSEGHLVAANAKACELVGYSRDEMGSFRVDDLVPPEDLPLLSVCYDDIASGKAAIVEHRLQRKDGSHLEVETSARKLANGRYQAILRDITDRKRREAEFTRTVQPEAFDKLFAVLRELRHGEGLTMNLHRISLFAKNLQLIMEESAEDGGPASVHGQEGSSVPVHSSPRTRLEIAAREFIKVGYQRLRGIAALLRIVESKIIQGSSPGEEHIFARDLFTHTECLKTDVEEALQLIQYRTNGGPTVAYSDLGNRIADHVDELFHGIAAITRQLNAHFTANVGEVVRTIITSFQCSYADTTMEVREESDVAKAIISPADLAEVLSLLIMNSLDALAGVTAVERKIIVRLRVKDSRARIEVEDNGPGVPPEIRSRVFEAGVTTKGSGRGYGLSYARKHLSKYGGTLAYDERFQHGARFGIELVLA